MITQNPIIGRSRKKVGNVYARTLWGKNILQSCPTPSTNPTTKKQKANRSAFALVSSMANMFPASLLNQIYYTQPDGRSRRHVLCSQLYTAMTRNENTVTFNPSNLSELGTNRVVTNAGLLYTVPAKSFTIPVAAFPASASADTTRVPLVVAVSFELAICVDLLSYTELDGDNLVFSNISDTLLNHDILLLCLWQTDIGTTQLPNYIYGSFKLEP